ncbi:sporulation related domain protein [Collimonas arenae]|uniref:Sporulation related domain protein n=1 Tax=Collimonas arenae TaxID=279058 RepID=A0A127QJM1_9BURK|nr:SPOR domain-containing protein [Collimonas arenae]AMP00390.1 sporulation related domain protein [Collimonas arenae]AMP10268.1 sporulation related domain protein [Collimonas arenae]
MGLFSFLRKNKQQTDPDQGVYRSRDDTGIGPGAEQAELPLRTRKARASKAANQQNEAVDPVLPEKKRARRRLVGAIALVLAVVIVLPMILDSEPKPLPEDIAIQIPSRDKPEASASASSAASVSSSGLDKQEEIVDPASSTPPAAAAVTPPAVAAPAPITTPPASATVKPATPDSLAAVTPPMPMPTPKPVAPKPEVKPKPEAKPKVEAKAKSDPMADKNDDSARALAILDGHSDATPAPEKKPGKFVLQVAALESQDRVNELQGKLKGAGIRSYTQKVPTASGERIRIRVGPFSSKEEAEKTRAKLAKLGLNGSLIPG